VALVATISIAGCAYSKRAEVEKDTQENWQGRLSVRVETSPVQTLSAAFELRGDAQQGELTLTSPLGTMVAQARWAPGSVQWHTANDTRIFSNLDAMAVELTGTSLPMAALFDWLHGIPSQSSGWEPDLKEFDQGRISARRIQPAPLASIRVVLDR
jgi:outer membrane lipoprotein LolB